MPAMSTASGVRAVALLIIPRGFRFITEAPGLAQTGNRRLFDNHMKDNAFHISMRVKIGADNTGRGI